MDMENIKNAVKQSIVQNFMEAAKHTPRGASHQRPKSWDKGTKSGSEKRKMREQGKREAKEMQEGVSPFKKWELYHELKHEDAPNFQRDMRQDREISRMDANAKWAMQSLMPVYEKHGMAKEHAGTTDQYGFPSYGHAVSHPNFKSFVNDFIAFHTAENKKHWAEKGKASSYHWPAILRAKQGLESLQRHEDYKAKQQQTGGDLSEGESWGPEVAGASQDDATAAAYEQQDREQSLVKKPSHADVIEMLNRAHETALSRIATSYGKGGKHAKQDPYYMLGHYIEHLEDLHGPIRGDLT
jgi:hypothetical protein